MLILMKALQKNKLSDQPAIKIIVKTCCNKSILTVAVKHRKLIALSVKLSVRSTYFNFKGTEAVDLL